MSAFQDRKRVRRLTTTATRWWSLKGLFFKKICQKFFPLLGQKALRMILDPLQRPSFVTDAHNFVVVGPGGDFIFTWQGAVLDDQAVVTRGGEGVRHPAVNRFAIVMDL